MALHLHIHVHVHIGGNGIEPLTVSDSTTAGERRGAAGGRPEGGEAREGRADREGRGSIPLRRSNSASLTGSDAWPAVAS